MKTQQPTRELTPDALFFFQRAGCSYDPKTETRIEGRTCGAERLADAERKAREVGLSFEWSVDPDCNSGEWNKKRPFYDQWLCLCHGADGSIVSSLGCIDFGRDGSPWADPYKRVVEAELALEALLP